MIISQDGIVRQFGVFLSNGLLVFCDFLPDGRYLEYLKAEKALFPGKKCPK